MANQLIIGTGFQKTGTSSLREALQILGYKVGDNNHQMLWPILHGNWSRVKAKALKYDALEDNPWPIIYKELDQHIPNAKFIHTERSSEGWYSSVNNHVGDLVSPMHEWIYGRGKSLPKDYKQNTIDVFEKHNNEVKAYFKNRPTDLLILNIREGEGWEKLCPFLGVDVPEVPFPHYNKAKYTSKPNQSTYRKFKVLKKRIKYWVQIKYLRLRGFL
jgi:hypothetical protein|tara:strand:- start:1560 stop:2207 length:648 start_codon:yes stop_codon:yes gene_type:complete